MNRLLLVVFFMLLFASLYFFFFFWLLLRNVSATSSVQRAETTCVCSTQQSATATVSVSPNERCIKMMQSRFIRFYSQFITDGTPVALVDLPLHWNLGDSFIWLGEVKAIQQLGGTITYTCYQAYNRTNLAKALGNTGIILLHGGGNFGDLYEIYQEFRKRIMTDFPSHKIIMFPQSVYFSNASILQTEGEYFGKFPNFTLVARCQRSMEVFKEHFAKNPKALMPDAAFMIGTVTPIDQPKYDVVYLSRDDKEKILSNGLIEEMKALFQSTGISFIVFDWSHWSNVNTEKIPEERNLLPEFRLNLGNRLLSMGRVIISDRLHAVILSVLMNKPIIALDNNYGKISGYIKTFMDAECCSGIKLRQVGKIKDAVTEVLHMLKN